MHYCVEDARFVFDPKLGRYVMLVAMRRRTGLFRMSATFRIVLPRVPHSID